MGKINIANLKKAFYYLKRNGLKNTWSAARERMSEENTSYCFIPPDKKYWRCKEKKQADILPALVLLCPHITLKRNICGK